MEERAGFWIRLGAGILDSLIIGFFFGLITWVIYGELYHEEFNVTDLLSLLYMILLPVFWRGYVIGKRLVNIRIVKESGEDVTISTMLLRVLVGGLLYAFTFGIAAMVSAFMVGLREDKKSIHD
ncbi:RDD family protein, partial [Salibacterium aidingense]|uniref:RDD family protein n=1 Tax=Salibacterium aidingense TaxID=384933 RepID=UPI00042050B4